jgi:hypothetical protein
MTESNTPPTDPTAELPAPIREALTRYDAAIGSLNGRISKMGQDLGAVRARVKGGDDAKSEPKEPPPPSITPDDLDAAIRFGELRAQLPAKVRTRLEEMRAAGAAYSAMLSYAEVAIDAIAEYQPAVQPSAGRDAAAGPRGYGATPPRNAGPSLPKTQAEYIELRKTDPKRAAAISEQPDFDFRRLPQR